MADLRYYPYSSCRVDFCQPLSGPWCRLSVSTKFDGPERRAKARYLVILAVRYRALTGPKASGVGTTVNLSSKGIFIAATQGHNISAGSQVELIIKWPMLLDGTIPLEFVVLGRVVRSDESRFAVSLVKFDFRTKKKEPGISPGSNPRSETG